MAKSEVQNAKILTPITGEVIDITDVEDPVFSQKMMGDGFGIHPTDGQVVAPVDGSVTMVADTKHAIGITTPEGLEVLIHLGIDTVELKGAPFTVDIKVGDNVKAGQAIAKMDLDAVKAANKKTTVILAITNTSDKLLEFNAQTGNMKAGDAVATAAIKPTVVENNSKKKAGKGAGKYDQLATDIIKNVGGVENINSLIHCITRLRFYLKDDSKANDDVIANLDGVIDVAKAGGQYQVVIGPAVTDVYDAVIKQIGPEYSNNAATASAVADTTAAAKRPTTTWGWVKYGFSNLIGVITGSMIPVIGLLAASGILKGILALLTQFHLVDTASSTYIIINAMGDSVFFFLPIFIGFTAAQRLGADPVIMGIVGGVLTYPAIIQLATGKATSTILGMGINATFFGLPIHIASYSYSIFPMIVAAWIASKLEPWLKRVIPTVLRMIFVPLFEVVIVSGLILFLLGPIITLLSGYLAQGIVAVYNLSPSISGLLIGGFYQVLVIFGLHWAVIPIVANDIATTGHSYLNAIISATMVAQGGAVMAVAMKSKLVKIQELAWPATISAFSGVTEPAMYGINLKYGRAFVTASIGGAVGGFLTGLFHVNMWGFTGSLIGFPSFVNPHGGMDFSFWGFLIASAATIIVSFTLTYMFGYSDADAEQVKTAPKKRHLGETA